MNYLSIFLWIVKSSLIGSVIVLLIFTIKFLLRKRLSPIIIYYLWMILLIKLIVPFGPQSPISVYNIFNSSYESVNNYVINKKPVTTPTIKAIETPETGSKVVNKNDSESKPKIKKSITLTGTAKTMLSYKKDYAFIWIIGMLLLGLYTLFGVIAIIRTMKFGKHNNGTDLLQSLEQCKAEMNIKKKVNVVTTSHIASPFIYGIFSPTIIIPYKVYETIPKEQLRYILLHELCHLKRRDTIVNWIISMLKIVYWFNPIIMLGLKSMQSECELACDSEVLIYLKNTENFEYGTTIINVAKLINKKSYLQAVAGVTSMAMNKSELKRRILMISRNNKINKKGILFGLLIILVLGIVGLSGRVIRSDSKVKDAKSSNSPQEFLKANNIKVSGAVKKFEVTVPDNWDVKAGEYPIGLYWQLANEFSKDAGLDLTKLKGSKVQVWKYSLADGLLSQENDNNFKYPSNAILLVKSNNVVGAWFCFNTVTIGPSVKKHYLKDITGYTFDEWVEHQGLFSNMGNNSDLKSLDPEGVIKEYCKAINENNKQRAYACLSYDSMLDALTINLPDMLYNSGFIADNTQEENIVSVKFISINYMDPQDPSVKFKQIGDRTTIEAVIRMDIKWRTNIASSNGEQDRFCMMKKTKTGWKLGGFGTGP